MNCPIPFHYAMLPKKISAAATYAPKPIYVPATHRNKILTALRATGRRQIRGALRLTAPEFSDCFCQLGALLDTYWPKAWKNVSGWYTSIPSGSSSVISPISELRFAIYNDRPADISKRTSNDFEGLISFMVTLNDQYGYSFADIADYFEASTTPEPPASDGPHSSL